ncbi:MAG: beta-lactamase family protein [Lachnospiraceae bacterium]|nr:beta-lactamase family protein [Lachnospiraceae bacterium]
MKNRKLKYMIGAALLAGIVGLSNYSVAAGDNETASDSASDKNNEYIYCVGSVSKVYVTAAVMRLVDEGKVKLNDPVTEYIPDFKMADERYKDITVRMLMDHTSGIMGTSQVGSFLYDSTDTYHHDHLLDTLSKQRLKADPGKYAAYCNDGFDLLELIVENVSGMSYTDYVSKMVASPTGGSRTGSNLSFIRDKDLAPAYTSGNLLYDNESCMCIGAGGVYSTASDVAKFGTSFFNGIDSLLSDKSKAEMSKAWNGGSDEYEDCSSLGWDSVTLPKYEEKSVKVLGKGGDVLLNHAYLMVAPDEEISIAVLSTGGSSMYNGMLAEAIMDAALNTEGIEAQVPQYEPAGDVPSEYDDLAGYYTIQNALEGGAVISSISFPGHKYMHVENTSPVNTSVTDYVYVGDGEFAELAYEVEDIDAGAKIAGNPTIISFVKKDGGTYIAAKMKDQAPGLGTYDRSSYIGEKIEANPVSEESLAPWEAINGKNLMLSNDVFSSANYMYGIAAAYTCKEVPGYVFLITGQGTRLLKIEDGSHALAFQTMPSSSNRDLIDVTITGKGNETRLVSSSGFEYILEDSIPEFNGDLSDERINGSGASWFKIGSQVANGTVSIERSEDSEIYVYNKYGDVIYTTHIKDAATDVPMPKDGWIVFLNSQIT